MNDDDQRVTIPAHFNIVEQVLTVECTNSLPDADPVNRIPNIDRQVVEDRTFRDTLQSFNSHVFDNEVIRCHR